jgi:hypothetical protein
MHALLANLSILETKKNSNICFSSFFIDSILYNLRIFCFQKFEAMLFIFKTINHFFFHPFARKIKVQDGNCVLENNTSKLLKTNQT